MRQQTVLLSEIADIQTGPFGSQLHNEDYVDYGTPIVTVEHLGCRRFTSQNLPFVSHADKERLSKYTMQTGDTIFSRVGSVDRCSFVSAAENGWMFSGRCLRVRPSSNVDGLFLYYYLSSKPVSQYIRNVAVGATMPSINTTLLGEVPVNLPVHDNQSKIASILSVLDDMIEVNQRSNDYLYELIDSVFAKYFPCIDASGAPSIETIENLGFSPTDIGSLCKNVTDGTHSTVKDDPAGTCLLLSCKNVKNGALITSDKDRRISKETLNKLRKRTNLAKGDILLTSVGTIGEMALLRTPPNSFEFQRSVALIKPDTELVSSEFLYSYMRAIARHIRAQAHGAVQQCIFINDIKQIAAFHPGHDLVTRFTDLTRPMFDLIASNEDENRSLADLRNTLLPKLMSGEIDVSQIELPTRPNNHLSAG